MMEHVRGMWTGTTELDELQEIARLATRTALEDYERIPDDWDKNLTLGISFEGDDRIFELYVAAENPSDAVVISSSRVNRKTKEVVVSVTNLSKK